MASIQTFRQQVTDRVALVIHFPNLFARDTLLNTVLRFYRESRTAYTEEVVTPVRQTSAYSTIGDIPINPVDPLRIIDSLRAGEKAFQLRVWQIDEDRESSSNEVLVTAGVEIEVHRRLAFADEEYLYTSDEMLDAQGQLLDHAAWLALTSLDSFVETPTIDGVPERDNDIIRYTVAFSAVVSPS